MKTSHLIVVGKLKDKNLESIETDYLKRIKNPGLKIHEVKANAEDPDFEAAQVLKKAESVSTNYELIIMTEFGEEYHSVDFSEFIYQKLATNKDLIFVICGAQGPSDSLSLMSNAKLSLSKLTFPHKLARVLFVEQFYRAQTINDGHPYHN